MMMVKRQTHYARNSTFTSIRVSFTMLITESVMNGYVLARSITPQMAKILERLEHDRPSLVTSRDLSRMLLEENIATPTAVFASRLRERGWLIATGQRGVWEFSPADYAGAYSSMDILTPLKVFSAAHEGINPMLTGHSMAWAFDYANRSPMAIDAVLPHLPTGLAIPAGLRLHTFEPRLETVRIRGVLSLSPDSVIVHMAARPSQVYSWQSASEWLPEIAYDITPERIVEELSGRPKSIVARTGYLLQGMRPDVAGAVYELLGKPSKVRFGPRTKSRRNDEHWGIADTILPFDPKVMVDTRCIT